MKTHKPKMLKCKLVIPSKRKVPADRTIEYIADFDRMNGLRPAPYVWRGNLVNKDVRNDNQT